ncbi:hypothetical protein BFP72_01985 [Reichenbachiella sp. 5M10]|uniref:SulP family inorganic anion transporter n=1 Tax=Reichenbachiella sp. 5M10 TaxID=1889772 RepID=UPI000C15F3D7|nr:sulfate permease [Reichenbachiella sp. 5M10]PIB34286.1 hypothetical protein BFP72_01985 [Reichenbachiella sp. 5M10]
MIDRLLPILHTLKHYSRAQLKGDVMAGMTVGVMIVPQGMAYAMIAGLPPVYGLYASIFPPLIYALFGSSRQLSIGPVAMDSLLIATGVSSMAVVGSGEYIALVILLAFMIGVMQLMMGVFRLGFLTNFLSRPVIMGFTHAAVLIITVSHLSYFTGVQLSTHAHLHGTLIEWVTRWDEVDVWTLLLGLGSFIVIFAFKKWSPRVPSGLVVLVGGATLVYLLGLDQVGVETVGTVPAGLPDIAMPSWTINEIRSLLPIAFSLALIGFIEAYSIGKTLQFKHNNSYEVKANKELVALGLGNVVGSFFSSFSTSGSFSRSAVNDKAGAQTTLALVYSAVIVVVVLLFLTPLFYFLPKVVLAAIIVVGVLALIDIPSIVRLYRTDSYDFILLMVAFVGTIVLGIVWGVMLGVVLSLMVLVYKTNNPHIAELGQIGETTFFRNLSRFANAINRPEIGIVRFDAILYFANVAALKEKVAAIVAEKPEMKTFVLDAQSISDIDSTGLDTLREIFVDLKGRGIVFKVTSVIGPVRDKLHGAGLVEQIGVQHFHDSIGAALGVLDVEDIPFQTNR